MVKITLQIEGMMSPRCEARVSKAIETAFSVQKVTSSHQKNQTEIICEEPIAEDTIKANSRFFTSIDEVPTRALTMGMGSIMMAKRIILLANGKNKHAAVAALLDNKITTAIPATLLKLHPDVIILCDKEAYHG